MIGATTIEEYRKYIEKDAALERRFQPVTVEEPDEEQAMAILTGLRPQYEAHHHVKITDEGIAVQPYRCQSATSMTGICRTKPLISWMRRLPEYGLEALRHQKQMKETEQAYP